MNSTSSSTIFYLIRHGQTEWNVLNLLHGGGSDTPLNQTGKKQAQKLAHVLKNVHFDAVFSSDLKRSIETVKGIALEKNLTIKTAKALREKHYGQHEGRHRLEVKEELKDLFAKWEKLNDSEKMKFRIYKSGETDEEAITRFIRYLRKIALTYPEKTILISTHGGIMRYLLIKLGWGTYKELDPPSVPNSSYIKVACDGIDFTILKTYHIKKAVV